MQLSQPHLRLSRFDKTVITVLFGLIAFTGVLVWRGDRIGLQVEAITPLADSTAVSARAKLHITFDQAVVSSDDATISISPSIAGTVNWENGRILTFTPDDVFQPNTAYSVRVSGDLLGEDGRKLLDPIEWQFETGTPRLLYIAWDEARTGNQLFTITPDGESRTQLTQEPFNVLDYAVSPDGQTIVYTATRDDGGSDMWRIDRDGSKRQPFLLCPEGACSRPAWSQDGQRIIYERRTYLEPGAPVGPPRLWWVDVWSGATTAVFADSQWIGMGGSFSSDGQWLSYTAPQTQEVHAYNLQDGSSIVAESRTGEPPAWSPTENILLATEVYFEGDDFGMHIIRIDIATNEISSLRNELLVNDSWPTFSADGQWVAFTRKVPRTAAGKQVWLMQPDGSEVRQLTLDDEVHFGPPQWSNDGRYLTFQGYALTRSNEPGIWLHDLTTGETKLVATPGIRPTWLP